jgi:hypothetical protein
MPLVREKMLSGVYTVEMLGERGRGGMRMRISGSVSSVGVDGWNLFGYSPGWLIGVMRRDRSEESCGSD